MLLSPCHHRTGGRCASGRADFCCWCQPVLVLTIRYVQMLFWFYIPAHSTCERIIICQCLSAIAYITVLYKNKRKLYV